MYKTIECRIEHLSQPEEASPGEAVCPPLSVPLPETLDFFEKVQFRVGGGEIQTLKNVLVPAEIARHLVEGETLKLTYVEWGTVDGFIIAGASADGQVLVCPEGIEAAKLQVEGCYKRSLAILPLALISFAAFGSAADALLLGSNMLNLGTGLGIAAAAYFAGVPTYKNFKTREALAVGPVAKALAPITA